MSTIRNQSLIRRNDKCPCGSGKKFKVCHSPDSPAMKSGYAPQARAMNYIDTGESPVKYVICDDTGVKFFSDVDNKILVFSSREEASAIVALEEFAEQAPGEINIAGVGPTKWEHLQAKLPYVEVQSVEHGVELVHARIAKMKELTDGQEGTEETTQQESPAPEGQESGSGA